MKKIIFIIVITFVSWTLIVSNNINNNNYISQLKIFWETKSSKTKTSFILSSLATITIITFGLFKWFSNHNKQKLQEEEDKIKIFLFKINKFLIPKKNQFSYYNDDEIKTLYQIYIEFFGKKV